MIFKLFNPKNNAAFSKRQVLRFGVTLMMIGMVGGIATAIYSAPVIEDITAYFEDLGTVTVQASTTPQVVITEQEEKIDRYADEIFEERLEAYKRDARLRAIEKMQDELETEKESIREVELKTGGESLQ